jgi:hypothetical protein
LAHSLRYDSLSPASNMLPVRYVTNRRYLMPRLTKRVVEALLPSEKD